MRRSDTFGEPCTSEESEGGDQEFLSPEAPAEHTDYGLNYTDSRRIVNPFGASTSRAAAAAAAAAANLQTSPTRRSQARMTARKSTGRAPNRRFAPPKKRAPQAIKLLREIRQLQNSTSLLVPKLPFARLVRELIAGCSHEVTRITMEALMALQESTEIYITQRMHDAYLLTLHRGRVTLSVKDLELLRLFSN